MKLNLFAVLGVVLVVLKLFGLISWSWWLVVAPFVINVLTWIFIFVVAVISLVAAALAANAPRGRR